MKLSKIWGNFKEFLKKTHKKLIPRRITVVKTSMAKGELIKTLNKLGFGEKNVIIVESSKEFEIEQQLIL